MKKAKNKATNKNIKELKKRIYALHNLKSRKGKPEDYLQRENVMPTNWNPQATCPRWERFMDEIFDGDREMVLYMQRVLGYALTGICREHVLFILHGAHGFNGKSLMFETIKYILGPLAQKVLLRPVPILIFYRLGESALLGQMKLPTIKL